MIYADVDGKPVPLKDCCWIQRRPCGCLTAALTAMSGEDIYATEEQAHKELHPRKRDRDRQERQGLQFTLMTFPQYRELNGGEWFCPEHQKPAEEASHG